MLKWFVIYSLLRVVEGCFWIGLAFALLGKDKIVRIIKAIVEELAQ